MVSTRLMSSLKRSCFHSLVCGTLNF